PTAYCLGSSLVAAVLAAESTPRILAALVDARNDDADRDADLVKHRLAELKARLGRLGHRIGDTEAIELAGVIHGAGARDDDEIIALGPGDLGQAVDLGGSIHGDDQRLRGGDAAAP